MIGFAIVPLITAGSEVAEDILWGDDSFAVGLEGLASRVGFGSEGCEAEAGNAGTLNAGVTFGARGLGNLIGSSPGVVAALFSHIEVTDVTMPPFPPLAERTSYLPLSNGSWRAAGLKGFLPPPPRTGDIATETAACNGDNAACGDGSGGEGNLPLGGTSCVNKPVREGSTLR